MAHQVVALNCPNCGDTVDTAQKTCRFCRQPVIISTFNSVFSMPAPLLNKYAGAYRQALATQPDNRDINLSIAMCYLKLRLFDKALGAFEKAMEDNFDNADAICLLRGQKAFLAQRPQIDKIEEYITAAIMIEPKGIYFYFLAYIKYDYFSRKSFNTKPTYQDAYAEAQQKGFSQFDVEQLYAILGVSKPDCI
jgi:tetratricopeptide (TPR) repeat protein